MYYIGNVVKSVAGIYNEINAATLTGSIDIVVIEQEDGSFIGSPFHVRFGKLGVLSSREKVVEIAINDEDVDLHMKLGVAGEAFFVERASKKENVPVNFATSPLPSSENLHDFHFGLDGIKEYNTDEEGAQPSNYVSVKASRAASLPTLPTINNENYGEVKTVSHSISIPGAELVSHEEVLEEDQHLSLPMSILSNTKIRQLQADYPLSDMDSPISSPLSRSPEETSPIRQICSDTEIEVDKSHPESRNITWEWGMLPKSPAISNKSPREVKANSVERKKKTERHKKKSKRDSLRAKVQSSAGLLLDDVLAADTEVAELYFNRTNSVDDVDSGFDRESTPVTPPLAHPATPPLDDNEEPITLTSPVGAEEQNKDDTLPLSDFNELTDVDMSLCGDLKNRMVQPEKFFESRVTFEQFCGNPEILNDPKLVIKIDNRYYNWAVAAPFLMSYLVYQKMLIPESLKLLKQKYMPKKRRGWFSWRAAPEESSDEDTKDGKKDYPLLERKLSSADELDSDNGNLPVAVDNSEFKKTLRLTSQQWSSLDLKRGSNKVTFTVTTRYQGTASCDARIFLWNYLDKIVISDIDGTITRSDVLGHILTAVGRDWSQSNVAGLFSKIKTNGYQFMYLSARAIGQAQITRDFLRSVKQGEMTLPDGPVLLTPTSLFSAFRKEVIERKPEEFKISCMRDVRSLFPKDSYPFFSGFGNKVNDVWAYRAVGIPITRIFSINYKGEIKNELTNAFSSSYAKLIDLVDQMFPPLNCSKTTDPSRFDYTSFCYWRTPIMDLPEDDVDEFEFP